MPHARYYGVLAYIFRGWGWPWGRPILRLWAPIVHLDSKAVGTAFDRYAIVDRMACSSQHMAAVSSNSTRMLDRD
jgi:hypothetical protein